MYNVTTENWSDRQGVSNFDLAVIMGNTATSRDGVLRVENRVQQSAMTALSIGPRKPGRLRTKGGLNVQLERHENAKGPPEPQCR